MTRPCFSIVLKLATRRLNSNDGPIVIFSYPPFQYCIDPLRRRSGLRARELSGDVLACRLTISVLNPARPGRAVAVINYRV